MEIWDAYYSDGSLAGKDLVRGEKIPDGLFHLVSEVILEHTDGSFLAMQRDFSKSNYPGLYEITAGGSALKGETPIECAQRELFEETGIKCSKLNLLETHLDGQCIYSVFSAVTGCDKLSVKLQEGETVSYKWIPKNEVVSFLCSDNYVDINRKRVLPYISSKTDLQMTELSCLIGCIVKVVVDRPLGSVHPLHKDIVYEVNYGYVKGIIAPDGEEQDVYILGATVPVKEFTGRIIAVIHRKDDIENKWVAAPENMHFTKDEIISMTNFQEQFFDTEIIL